MDRDIIVYYLIPLNLCVQFGRRAWYFIKTGISPDIVEAEIHTAYTNGYHAGHVSINNQFERLKMAYANVYDDMHRMQIKHQQELYIAKQQGYQEGLHAALKLFEQQTRKAAPQTIIVKEKVKAKVVPVEETLTEKDYEIVEGP